MNKKNRQIKISDKFYTFAFFKMLIEILGTTGFDCKVNSNRSMSSHEIALVNLDFNFINGEDNFALAA